MTAPPVEAARPAAADDLAAIGRLFHLASIAIAPERGGAVHLTHELRASSTAAADLAAAVTDANRLVLVGTIDAVVVGYLVAVQARGHDGAGVLVRVTDLFVEEDGRSVGVGHEMLLAACDWAAAHGAIGLDAYALPGARNTKNFFEAHGFKARLLVVHHSFAPGTPPSSEAQP